MQKIFIYTLLVIVSNLRLNAQSDYYKIPKQVVYMNVSNQLYSLDAKYKSNKYILYSKDGEILRKENEVYFVPKKIGNLFIFINTKKNKCIDSIKVNSLRLPRFNTMIGTNLGTYSYPLSIQVSRFITAGSGFNFPFSGLSSYVTKFRIFVFNKDTFYRMDFNSNKISDLCLNRIRRAKEGDIILIDNVNASIKDKTFDIESIVYPNPYLTVLSKNKDGISISSINSDNYDTSYLYHFDCFAGRCYIERIHDKNIDIIRLYKSCDQTKKILFEGLYLNNFPISERAFLNSEKSKYKANIDTADIKQFIEWDLSINWKESGFNENKEIENNIPIADDLFNDTSFYKYIPDSLKSFFDEEQRQFLDSQYIGLPEQWDSTFIPKNIKLVSDFGNEEYHRSRHDYSFPIYTKDHNYIIVIKSTNCGNLCGQGCIYIYQRYNKNQWKLYTTFHCWIS